MEQRKHLRQDVRRNATREPASAPASLRSVSDYLTSGVIVRPVQFYDIWHRSHVRQPAQYLALAVVQQAADDLRRYRHARLRADQMLYRDAYGWVMSGNRAWPYAFLNLCDALQLAPESLRVQLLDQSQNEAA